MRRLFTAASLAMLAGGAGAAEPVVIDAEAHFPEGPVVVDGTLWYVEYAGQTLMRWGRRRPARRGLASGRLRPVRDSSVRR